ncbi:hypothetical protein [Roseovarius nanhaiticus]|uniref:hypothetical protein n=1 Tax=Roseovarius nanhaiticus TaxID=573024 RepID=UPI00248F50A4|nr:hypothetical protein [Roseovarius nanhaiticus]
MFVTYGAGHADIVARLVPALVGRGLPQPAVLALTTAPLLLGKAGVAFKRCADYLPMPGYEDAVQKGAELARDIWSEGSDVSWEETCAYLGVSFCDLERDYGQAGAQRLFEAEGRKAFCPVHFMMEVLKRERPDIVVTTCHVRMERATTIAAQKLGIRSVLIEDLLGYSLLGPYSYGAPGRLIDRAEWPDMAVVMNCAVKAILTENGFPPERVVPLGQPVFSDWKRDYAQADPCDPFERTRGDRPLISYMTTPQDEILRPQSDFLIAMARRRRDLDFIVKLHPSTSEANYRQAFGPFPDNLRVLSKEPTLNVVKASDLVILYRSTVGILCLLSATPMIVWDTTGAPELLPYASSGAAEWAKSDEALEPLMDRMLAERSARRSPQSHPLFDAPAEASEAIAAWLEAGAPAKMEDTL